MSKLPKEHKFIDVSDYGRPAARIIAKAFKDTSVTPVQITFAFIISGLIAIAFMLIGEYYFAAFFLILKSILDAADGELARIKNTPSYTGRYFDSIADIILNFLFLLTIAYITETSYIYALLAFLGIELQGTLYNYYYVILRNKFNGDTTSRVFESSVPIAMNGENQHTVDKLYKIYILLYAKFDRLINLLDPEAIHSQPFPNWFMTAVSIYGLGFQLLIMSLMLISNLENYIIPFFMAYSIFIFLLIGIRRLISK
jgi:phosphatidylglycerophosphate synthase